MPSTAAKNLDMQGFHIYGEILSKDCIGDLFKKMTATRDFGPNLFLSKQEYSRQQNHFNTNPNAEFNFLNQFSNELAVVEKDKRIDATLTEVLGQGYEVVIKKAVCGVPEFWLPAWVKEKIDNVNVANLGPYIKKEYRDITYFRGIDFHQDIIDWPAGSTDLDPSTFLTLYVYLHDVDRYDSPLHILPGTHRYGSTLFPHKLKRHEENTWSYKDDCGKCLDAIDTTLTGGPGFVGLWHNCLLHGTQPVKHESEKFRLSLRYLLAKSNTNNEQTAIDNINKNIDGTLRPIRTRRDLDKLGKAKIKGNIINK